MRPNEILASNKFKLGRWKSQAQVAIAAHKSRYRVFEKSEELRSTARQMSIDKAQ